MKIEEYLQWKQSKVTAEFFQQLKEQSLEIEEDTLTGGCLESDPGSTAQKYAERVGFSAAMRLVMSFEPEVDE